MPVSVEASLIQFLARKELEWASSDDGKKEINRLKVNELHRAEYARKKKEGSKV